MNLEETYFKKKIDTININELNVVLTTDAKPTSIPDLYYYDIAYDEYSYIGKKNIIETNKKKENR